MDKRQRPMNMAFMTAPASNLRTKYSGLIPKILSITKKSNYYRLPENNFLYSQSRSSYDCRKFRQTSISEYEGSKFSNDDLYFTRCPSVVGSSSLEPSSSQFYGPTSTAAFSSKLTTSLPLGTSRSCSSPHYTCSDG